MLKARELFDVAAATELDGGTILLITGLESTPQRNLDEFGRKADRFMMPGFRRFAAPKLEALINYIHKKGFSAETWGVYGYPPEGEINLKHEAVKAGIGLRGKHTVLLHSEYGPRLRLMGVKTTAPLTTQHNKLVTEVVNPLCRGCTRCLEVCPVHILESYRMIHPGLCLSNITPQTKNGHSMLCDKCISVCPAGNSLKKRKRNRAPEKQTREQSGNKNGLQ